MTTHAKKTRQASVFQRIAKTKEYQAYAREQDMIIEIAVQIKKVREALGLTQEELAARMGVTQPTIARIERTGHLSTRMLDRFCSATHTKIHFTFA